LASLLPTPRRGGDRPAPLLDIVTVEMVFPRLREGRSAQRTPRFPNRTQVSSSSRFSGMILRSQYDGTTGQRVHSPSRRSRVTIRARLIGDFDAMLCPSGYSLICEVYRPRSNGSLQCRIVSPNSFGVMADLSGDFAAYTSDFFKNWWCCHGPAFSPSNSIGVTRSGTYNPSIPFIRRICPNLFAFAKC